MRSHLWIVGLGLVVFACQSALAAMFSITSGSCTLSGDCIRTPNYPGQYSSENSNYYGRRLLQSYSEGNSCIFATLAAGTVSTTAFNTYSSGDYLRIGATYYRGAGSVNGPDSNGHDRYPSYSGNSGTTGPSGVSVSSGQQISWTVDNYGVSTGWELCLTAAAPTPSPTTAGPARMSTTGTCILSGTNGDCVSSPNYPNPYDSTDCTITNNLAGYLTAGNFSTESGYSNYDTLNIRRRGLGAYSSRRRNYAESTILNVYLEAGEQISWTTDTSGYHGSGCAGADLQRCGWQICNTAPTSAPTSEPTTAAPTPTFTGWPKCCAAKDRQSRPWTEYNGPESRLCGAYQSSCGALATKNPDCWADDGVTTYSHGGEQSSGYSCFAAVDTHSDDCCDTNGGAVAGIVIAILVFCVIIPVASCFFCASCPLAKSRNQKTVVPAEQIQPPPVSQPTAPIMHQPVQPPPQATPKAAQPIAMVAQPMMKQEAPPMAPPTSPPYQPQGASVAPTAFCASCGTANGSGGAFCASCGAQL